MSINSQNDNLILELVDGCKNSSLKCQEMLYKHFFGYALSVGMRYMGDRNEAIEVVDDSFLKVFEKVELYNNNLCFKAWLRKIVINTAIDKLRLKGYNEKEKKLNGIDILHKSTVETDCELNSKELINLLKLLPYLHRAVFNLFEIEGFNHKEISEFLNIPESSSRTYLTRAKKKLRELYKKYFQ